MTSVMHGPAPAEIAYVGEWSIDPLASDARVTFTLRYPASLSNRSEPTALATLGLTAEDLLGDEHPIDFDLRREQGTFVCTGTARAGYGAGSFRFEPDAAYARAIAAAGIPSFALPDHVKAAMFDVASSDVRAFAAIGFDRLTFGQLLTLTIFRNTPADVQAFHDSFQGADLDGLVGLKMVGVTPAYLDALRRTNVRDLSPTNVAALRAAGVDQSFIEELAERDAAGLSVDDIVRLHRESDEREPHARDNELARRRRTKTPARTTFDHITIDVSDLDVSRRFYDEALRPLGIERLVADGAKFIGYGIGEKAFFWIGQRGTTPTRAHIAFAARDRATVDRYFAAAIAAGGRAEGAPGLYAEYHPDYYGAFVLDPDGNNIEAVCHQPQ